MADCLLPFLFEGGDVRGAVVSLDAAWRDVLSRRAYPAPVRSLLGEAMAAAALLSSTLKFDGRLVLQAQAEAPDAAVRLMVVECDARLGLRATAKLGDSAAGRDGGGLAELLGGGRLVITLDPPDGQVAYQGVVDLEGADLAQALQAYMAKSEQIDTRFVLAADDRRAVGCLVQRLPGHGAAAALWEDASLIARTMSPEELLGLAPHEAVRRLYHAYDLRIFAERAAAFRCRCSRERVADMLRMLGRAEVDSIVAERGAVSVDCDFCHQSYGFDAIDAARLFLVDAAAGPDTRH
ncbi:MAG: Hsp33 family molecular chaperone HslO [Burkholderiales bacterium]|nr:Hsp33 family molecular chaperone HslO [Burkholderiales bacterium]